MDRRDRDPVEDAESDDDVSDVVHQVSSADLVGEDEDRVEVLEVQETAV